MLLFKSAPLEVIMLEICPVLYAVHNIDQEDPQRLPLSYERVNRDGAYLMDTGSHLMLYVCSSVAPEVLQAMLGVSAFQQVDEEVRLKAARRANTRLGGPEAAGQPAERAPPRLPAPSADAEGRTVRTDLHHQVRALERGRAG